MSWIERLRNFPEGASECRYREKKYLMRKETRLDGRLIKLYSEELGGRDFVSLNCYIVKGKTLLKPCEMPAEKVMDFIEKAEVF